MTSRTPEMSTTSDLLWQTSYGRSCVFAIWNRSKCFGVMVASEDDWAARELFVSCYLYDTGHEQPTRSFEKHTCLCFWNNTFASQARWGFAAVRDVRLAAHFPPALSAARGAWSCDSWRSNDCIPCGHDRDRSDLTLGLAIPTEVSPTLVTI